MPTTVPEKLKEGILCLKLFLTDVETEKLFPCGAQLVEFPKQTTLCPPAKLLGTFWSYFNHLKRTSVVSGLAGTNFHNENDFGNFFRWPPRPKRVI